MHKLMSFIITAATALGLITASLSLAPAEAQAAVPTSGLADCETGVPCTFYIGSIPFSTAADDVIFDDPDGGRRIVGSLELPIPGASIELKEAEMFFDPLGGDYEFVAGEARVPFPTMGFLADADIRSVPRAVFGMRPGSELQHLGAHLQPDREYLYFYYSSALEIGLPWAGDPDTAFLPQTITLDPGYTGTFVLDPSDPYFYVGGPCPDVGSATNPDGSTNTGGTNSGGTNTGGTNTGGTNTGGTDGSTPSGNTNTGNTDGDDASTTTNTGSDPASTDGTNPDGSSADDEEAKARRKAVGDALVSIFKASTEDLSQDCGIGFSLNGNIPGPVGPGQLPIGGHVVVDAKGTLPMGMGIDGTTIVEFTEGVRTVGYGKIAASVPLIDSFLDLSFPLGDALIDLETSGGRIGYAVSGMLETDGTTELPIITLPVALPGDGSVRVESQFGAIQNADGTWQVDPDSFFEAQGTIGIGPKPLGNIIGVELNNFAAAEAFVRIDRHALVASGSIGAEIHPALETDAGMQLDTMISFDAPETSYLAASGDMRVAGTTLGQADLLINNQGFFVSGMMTDTVTTLAMEGQITAQGASLQGTTTIDIPLDGLGSAAQSLVDAIDAAQRDVDRIDQEIADLTVVLTQERDAATADLRLAQDAVTTAQRSVDKINANIRSNNKKIKYLKGRISKEKRRYKRLSWINRARQAGKHTKRIASWNGAIAGLKTANAANYTARATATATLTATKATLKATEDGLNLVPFEADPRMIALVGARETATFALQTSRDAAGPLADLSGLFRATGTVRLATDGLSGGASAEWCTDSCVVLAGARISFEADGVFVCAVPSAGVPEVCGRL